MASSFIVDYSLRQNKAIERQIVFDCARRLYDLIDRPKMLYVGMGSVWFIDFETAHRMLNVGQMISIEVDGPTYSRALFNRPYRNVKVVEGSTYSELPSLLEDDSLLENPWFVWLDYDKGLDSPQLDEVRNTLIKLPPNSLLAVTFSARGGVYGKPVNREMRLGQIFGDAAPALSRAELVDEKFLQNALCHAMINFMTSVVLSAARKGHIFPVLQVPYKDGTPMGTVGVFLADENHSGAINSLVKGADWDGIVANPINLPPLTHKEVLALRSTLPTSEALGQEEIRKLGFDLSEADLEAFRRHYLRYPLFAELRR
jgi:hypothetical protein